MYAFFVQIICFLGIQKNAHSTIKKCEHILHNLSAYSMFSKIGHFHGLKKYIYSNFTGRKN